MRPFGGRFQCLLSSSSKSLAMNALWQKRLTKKEGKDADAGGLGEREGREEGEGQKHTGELQREPYQSRAFDSRASRWSWSPPQSKSALLATCLLSNCE